MNRFTYNIPNTNSPFGSVMPTRAWSDASRNYRYGFNGKEKDFETANDNYDFGARIYDGRLGRWLSVDPKAIIYKELSSFSAFANNPILYIDNQGKTLVIKNGGVSAMYFEGKLYTQSPDGSYTVPYVPGTNTFIDNTFKNIELLNSTSTGKSTLLRLTDKDAVEYTIMDGNVEKYIDGRLKENSYDEETNTIYFTNSNQNYPVEYNIPNEGVESPAFVVLAHEMGHALGEMDYKFDSEFWFYEDTKKTGRYNMSEIYASHIENMVRAENNLPLRTAYTKDKVYNEYGTPFSTELMYKKKSLHIKTTIQITVPVFGFNEYYAWDIIDYTVLMETEEFYDYSEQNKCEKNCD